MAEDLDLLQIYLEESLSGLEEVERVLGLCVSTQDPNLLPALFGVVHSIKGNTAQMAFEGLLSLLVCLETRLSAVLAEKQPLSEAVAAEFAYLLKGFRHGLGCIQQKLDFDPQPWLEPNKRMALFTAPSAVVTTTVGKPNDAGPLQEATVNSLRIPTQKIDGLLSSIERLRFHQSRLRQHWRHQDLKHWEVEFTNFESEFYRFEASILRLRMVSLKASFRRLERLGEEIAEKLNKKVNFHVIGEEVELDKDIIEKIQPALEHMMRNAIDHGIESAATRTAHHKSAIGQVTIQAHSEAGSVLITIEDDGGGIDVPALIQRAAEQGMTLPTGALDYNLIFQPGLSVSTQVSTYSGRGIGMDMVLRTLEGIGGKVKVESKPGFFTRLQCMIPHTLSLIDGQWVRFQNQSYVIPLRWIEHNDVFEPSRLQNLSGQLIYDWKEEYLPVLTLGLDPKMLLESCRYVIALKGTTRFLLLVEDIVTQDQFLVKSQTKNIELPFWVMGTTMNQNSETAWVMHCPRLQEK